MHLQTQSIVDRLGAGRKIKRPGRGIYFEVGFKRNEFRQLVPRALGISTNPGCIQASIDISSLCNALSRAFDWNGLQSFLTYLRFRR